MNVLFVCVANSGRSVMAERLFRKRCVVRSLTGEVRR
jgi:protein-tyrosine-phosphatase